MTLCDICQKPVWTGMAQPTGLHHFCTCDCRDRFTHGLKQEIGRLRGLARKAYAEGWEQAWSGKGMDWEASEARKGLGNDKPSAE